MTSFAEALVDNDIIVACNYNYDEWQLCYPGFKLAIGCFRRTLHGRFAEYHRWAEDVNIVKHQYLAESFAKSVTVVDVCESNKRIRESESEM